MANYSGIDKIDSFFAHYGRKGMKRGKNIFNPDYKPVGEVTKGPQAPGAKQSSGECEAMNRASSAATKSGVTSAREKLLEAERKRQAAIDRR